MEKKRPRTQKKRTKLIRCTSIFGQHPATSADRMRLSFHVGKVNGKVISIDVLPDDVLLSVFDFYVDQACTEAWQLLVHVCRRWRSVVFGSPCRLKLRLVCTPETPARRALDVWPPLPLLIHSYGGYRTENLDHMIAALERNDRVCQINLIDVRSSDWKTFIAAMRNPFPELTHLHLQSYDKMQTSLPDSFLGRSAPRLEHLWLNRILYPGLPKLLLSTTHLVDLRLRSIPYLSFPPEEMLAALTTLASLEELWLEFRYSGPFPEIDREGQGPPPATPSVLPVLTSFTFKGDSDCLFYLLAQIDAPRINSLVIGFFNQIRSGTSLFAEFISRTPTLNALDKARVTFGDDAATVNLSSQTSGYGEVDLEFICGDFYQQVLSLKQVFNSCLPRLSTMVGLYIYEKLYLQQDWEVNIVNAQWLELLRPFTTVRNLHLSKEIARRIVPALQELDGEETRGVLPTLQNIFLEELKRSGPVQRGIRKFAAARQLLGYPIAVCTQEKDPEWDSDSEWKWDPQSNSDSDSEFDALIID